MKRVAVLLTLMVCAQAHAQIQTWAFHDAQLYADPGEYVTVPGPAGSLTGHFDYDTSTHTITAFELNAGGAIFSSTKPQLENCEDTPCTGIAYRENSTKLVFDESLKSPGANERLELFLSAPIDGANGAIALDAKSVIHYNYEYDTIHVLGGSLGLSTSAISTPEPTSYAMLLFGLGIAAMAGRRARAPVLRAASV